MKLIYFPWWISRMFSLQAEWIGLWVPCGPPVVGAMKKGSIDREDVIGKHMCKAPSKSIVRTPVISKIVKVWRTTEESKWMVEILSSYNWYPLLSWYCPKMTVFISCCYCNKLLQISWLKISPIYYLVVLEIKVLKMKVSAGLHSF